MESGGNNMLDRTFKALADPTRLRILNLLIGGPLCVCDLGCPASPATADFSPSSVFEERRIG